MGFTEDFEVDISLGGFAECPEDIDGDEHDFECYNRGLADEYYNAFCGEDYEILGTIDYWCLDRIALWYDADDGKNHREEIEKGLIKTVNNRTFAEAVIADKKADFAEIFAYNGNCDINLIVTIILYGDDLSILSEQIAPEWLYNDGTGITYYINQILHILSIHYDQLETNEEKLSMLNRVIDVFKHTTMRKGSNKIHITEDSEFINTLKKSLKN